MLEISMPGAKSMDVSPICVYSNWNSQLKAVGNRQTYFKDKCYWEDAMDYKIRVQNYNGTNE